MPFISSSVPTTTRAETAQDTEEVSTLQQLVSNAQRHFELGNDPRLALAAQLHLDMILHGRKTRTLAGLRNTSENQPLTEGQKQWEISAAGLVKRGVSLGLMDPCKKLLRTSLLGVQITDLIAD